MKLPIITTLFIALSFLFITLAEAKVYQWKDAAGITHYSATPPRPNEKISNLKDDIRITDNKSVAYKKRKTSKRTTKQPEKKTEEIKQNFCNHQQSNLALLTDNINVKWIEKGKETKLTTKQREDKILLLRQSIKIDCNFNEGQEEDQVQHDRIDNARAPNED
ncbi:MAG: DUF4124 domain-containing protein [Cocleimonas sp.]|nr:DUF4124 domain-containing protein [Cocleimonas sp.]